MKLNKTLLLQCKLFQQKKNKFLKTHNIFSKLSDKSMDEKLHWEERFFYSLKKQQDFNLNIVCKIK